MNRVANVSSTPPPIRLGGITFKITGVIGSGGMGIVLKGLDPSLGRYAAIKVLAPHYASSGAARQRFAREARAAAAVVHDNVIAIHSVGQFNDVPYLIMPFIRGESLQKRLDVQRRQPDVLGRDRTVAFPSRNAIRRAAADQR